MSADDNIVVVEGIRPQKRRRSKEEFFPQEIENDILLRLPVRSLIRFTQVGQSWRSLIGSSAFIHAHLSRSIVQPNNQNDGVQAIFLQSSVDKTTVYSLLRDDGTPSISEYSKLIDPFVAYTEIKRRQQHSGTNDKMTDLNVGYRDVGVVGTCNGLVCLLARDKTTLIWNPCIQKFVVLPPPLPNPNLKIKINPDFLRSVTYAFGYDSCNDDYKVIRTVSCRKLTRLSCKFEIWSLARGSWKSRSAAVIPPWFSPGIYTRCDGKAFVNGALHWIQEHKDKKLIVSFDMSTELFGKIAMPKEVLGMPTNWPAEPRVVREVCFLSRYKESLAFLEKHETMGSNYTARFDMWVMNEYGIAESWTKLLTISRQELVLQPLVFRKSSVVFLLFTGYRSLRYDSVDPNTKQCNDFRINGYKVVGFADSFVESLVLLDQPNAISC